MTKTKPPVPRQAATNTPPLTHRHSGLPSVVWDESLAFFSEDDWFVFPDESLPRWAVFIDAGNHRTFVSKETWSIITMTAAAEEAFIEAYLFCDRNGLAYLPREGSPFATAAATEAKFVGTNVPTGKDRISALRSAAEGLILQAASLNARSAADRPSIDIFAGHFAQLREDLATLTAELEQASKIVDAAGLALLDVHA